MKKRIIASLAIIAMFGLAIAAYAYTQNPAVMTTSASCCKKDGDSCPMKGKAHDDKAGHGAMSCCKKHGDEHAKGGDHSKAEGHSCCEGGGESCPMKKEGSAATVSTDGKSCCDDCACCKGKHDPSVQS